MAISTRASVRVFLLNWHVSHKGNDELLFDSHGMKSGVNWAFLHSCAGLRGHTSQRLSGQAMWYCWHSTKLHTRWTQLSTWGKFTGIWNTSVIYTREERGSNCQKKKITIRRAHNKTKYPQMFQHHLWDQIQYWQLMELCRKVHSLYIVDSHRPVTFSFQVNWMIDWCLLSLYLFICSNPYIYSIFFQKLNLTRTVSKGYSCPCCCKRLSWKALGSVVPALWQPLSTQLHLCTRPFVHP